MKQYIKFSYTEEYYCWRSTSRSNDKDKLNFKQIDYVSIYFLSNRPMEHSFK